MNPQTTFNPFRLLVSICITLLTLTLPETANATHAAGSDIRYRCLGGLQYEIEVTFYRDCGGVSEPNTITATCRSVSGNHTINVTLSKVTGTVNGNEITVPCATAASTCNGGSSTGVRRWVYRGVVTLPSARADWVFSYSVCCRNCTITTISNPCASNSLLYVEATLDNLNAPCNSSPTFSNIPIAFVCSGQNFNYNHGVIDPDGDSLTYQLIAPKTSATANVSFIPPASVTSPLNSSTTFTVHPTTGDINFTSNSTQIGILAILVREFRNGQLIGSVIRDMQVYTQACSNNLPTATGMNGTNNFNVTVCPGQQICFTVNSADVDAAQNVTMTTNNGIPNASYTISSGSRPTLTFCWTPTSADVGLNPNTFTVTVRDNACPINGTQTYSFNIYVPSPYFAVTTNNVSCAGGNNGSATASPVYTNTYNYSWSTGATTSTISGLTPGTYTVTATDPSAGCSATASVNITQPAGMQVNNTNVNPSCPSRNNGSISLTVSGGSTPYSYNWSTGATSAALSNLTTGTYTVTVTDANGCSSVNSYTLSSSYNFSATATAGNINCFGQSTGSASVSTTGGASPFTYLWNNGSTNTSLNNIAAGTYTVTITDNNGCTATSTAVVTQPATAISASATKTDVNCFGNANGSITLTAGGGTAPYTYSWNNGSTAAALNGLSAGIYSVTVTDARGCTTSSTSTINQPASALSNATTKTDVRCFGNNTGVASVTSTGGTAPYSYSWNNGGNSSSISNLTAGTYSVTVTDSRGCTLNSSVTVNQPAAALSLAGTANSVACRNVPTGSISLSTSGGTSPYIYQWNNGSSGSSINNLAAGTYTVTATDANGCTSTGSYTVTQPAAALSVNAISNAVSCFGNSTGAINTTVTGGTSPYTYTWSNGSSSATATGISAGVYTLTVTDNQGCTATVTQAVTQPSAGLTVNSSSDNINCYGFNSGSALATPAGGTAPYSYNWSNGAATQGVNNLSPGSYSVVVTDANGCTGAASYTITEPASSLQVSATHTDINCTGNSVGSITLTVNGGTGPYNYNWSNGSTQQNLINISANTYHVTVSDANGCTAQLSQAVSQPAGSLNVNNSTTNLLCFGTGTGSIDITPLAGTPPYTFQWSNGSTQEDQSNLSAGAYTVVITDDNGCSLTNTLFVTEPAMALDAVTSTTSVGCYGESTGAIDLNVNGGTMPYSIAWDNGQSSEDLNVIGAGTYNAIVTDANGCTIQVSATVSEPGSALTISAAQNNLNCHDVNDGFIQLTVSGGTSGYTYAWSHGANTSTIDNLGTGNYTVLITDANGCTLTQNFDIVYNAPQLSSSHSVTPVSCFGDQSGAIDVTVQGGTAPYQFSWDNGQTTQNISGITMGTYSVTITDANGCTTTLSTSVGQPIAALSATAQTTAALCNGGNTGSIDISVSGGTFPYSYSWSTGASSEDITQLNSGTYNVTVTDANGCTLSQQFTINQPAAALDATTTTSAALCFGDANGAIDLSTTGGTGPYTYAWSNNSSQEDLSAVGAGTYQVTITDANGCTFSISAVVNQPAAPLSAQLNASSAACYGNASGSIITTTSGGTAPYNYIWNNGSTVQSPNGITSGTYTLTVTDNNGCQFTQSVNISQPQDSLQITAAISNISCHAQPTGSINITANGGTAPYTYQWNNGSTSEDPSQLYAGSYTVVVTDANGCTQAYTAVVNEPATYPSVSGTTSAVTCKGQANGSIILDVQGGTVPFSYAWSNGSATANLNNLGAGSYTVTVTDANGCTSIYNTQITEPALALSATQSNTPANCINGELGSITITVTGGTAPYIYLWSTGATTSQVSGLNPGNYSVKITDANGCETTSNSSIADDSELKIQTTGTDICVGDKATISTASIPNATYQWYYNGTPLTGATNLSFVTPVAGTYTLTATTSCGTYTSNPIEINVRVLTNVSVSNSVIICSGETVQLQAAGGVDYAWNPETGLDNAYVSNPVASPDKTTDYTVTVKDQYGCKASATVTVTVMCDTLDIPNGFSPNGDGINDFFVIDGISNFPGNVLFIYNRWGNLVYKKREYSNTWDGRSNINGVMFEQELPNGTYYYILDLNNDQKPLNSFVVLRR